MRCESLYPKRYSDSESITCTQRHNNIWTCEEGKKTWEWFCEARKCTQCLKVQFNFTRFVLEKSHFWGLFFTPGQWILNQTIKI